MEIDSEEENKALAKEIKRRGYTKRSVNFWIGLSEIHKYTNTQIHKYINRSMNFWIGLSDVAKEGDWRLASNGLPPSFLSWDENQPNNKSANDDCAWLRIGPRYSGQNKWSDMECDVVKKKVFSFHALCEFDSPEER